MHQPLQRGEHLLGGERVERRGRLVEHQHPRVRGEHRRRSRPAAAGRRTGRPADGCARSARPSRSRVSSTRLRITSAGRPERLHAVGELVLDGVGDEAGQRVLADVADDVGEVARPVGRGCRGRRRATRPGRVPPVKCGTSPLTARSSVDLPEPVRPTTSTSSPSGMVRSTPDSTGAGGVGVRHADLLEADHAATSVRSAVRAVGRAGARRRGSGGARNGGQHADQDAGAGQQRHRRHGGRRWPGRSRAGCRCTSTNIGRRGDHPAARRPATRAAPTGRGGSGCGRCAGRRACSPAAGDGQADEQHRQPEPAPTRCRRAARRRRRRRRAARRRRARR